MTERKDPLSLARAAVGALPLLESDTSGCAVNLGDNTNLWGAPPGALNALRLASSRTVARYPSGYSEPLHEAILRYLALDGGGDVAVVTGCGSDDVLDSTMRAFGAPGDRLAFSSPTFSMVPILARLNGLEPVAIPLTNSFDVDAQRLVDVRAKITYLCAPNNPTATPVSLAAVEHVVAHAHGIVLVDEAYAEFAPAAFVHLVARNERLIVARTFSKAFGLAGLRVGFGVATSSLARVVARARGPYKVGALAESAVLAALEPGADGLDWVRAHAALAVATRERLVLELRRAGFDPLPSAANFLMAPTAQAPELARGMRAHGVLVRSFTGLPLEIEALARNGGSALRIGIGPWDMMHAMLAALAAVMA